MSPLAVDGGTRFRLPGDAVCGSDHVFSPAPVAGDLARLRAQGEPEELEKGTTCLWPVEGGGVVGVRLQVWGPSRDRIRIDVEGCAELRWNLTSGELRLLARARDLYARGIRGWLERWLPTATWWTRGVAGLPVDKAHAEGWRTVGLEVNSDYTGMQFAASDADAWVGVQKVGRRGFVERRFDDVDSWGELGNVETIAVGSRANRVSVCVYNKARQIQAARGGDWSNYRATWKAHGFEPESGRAGGYAGPDVWRVELRLKGEALTLHTEAGDVIDLRDPMVLCDPIALARVWASCMRARRLTVRPEGNEKRRVWDTDPRWLEVIATRPNGVAAIHAEKMRQDRKTQAEHWQHASMRAAVETVRAALRFGALHNHVPVDRDALRDIEGHAFAKGVLLIGGEHEALTYAREYRKRQLAMCGEEIRKSGDFNLELRDELNEEAKRRKHGNGQ